MTPGALAAAGWVIAGGILLLLTVTIGARVVRAAVDRRARPIRREASRLIVAVTEGRNLPVRVRRPVRREVERGAPSTLATLRGDAAESVIEFLRANGLAARALRRLHRPGSVGRARAAARLGMLHATDATDDLVAALSDRSPEVRQVAARALGKVGGNTAARALLASLDQRRSLPASQIATAVVTIGPPAVPALRDALRTADVGARLMAAQLLGTAAAIDATADLEHALFADERREVRAAAAASLGRIGSPSSAAALIAACASSEPEPVRVAAAGAIGELGATAAIQRLAEMLGEAGYAVPHIAARSLAALGNAGRIRLVAAVARGESAGDHAAEALARADIRNRTRRAAAGRRSAAR